MSKANVTVRAPGVGFTGLLTIVFIILKLTGYIAWSWFWVLSPIIISFTLGLLILAGLLLVLWWSGK